VEIPRLTLLEAGHLTTRWSGRAVSAPVVGSRGKHLGWRLFPIIAIVALYAAGT
jgi:hypothetical protein